MTDPELDQLVEIKYKAHSLAEAVDGLCHAQSVLQNDLYESYPTEIKEECLVLYQLAEVKCKIILEELKTALTYGKVLAS